MFNYSKTSGDKPGRKAVQYQEQASYEARLRRKGRGRKSGFRSSLYVQRHDEIFGETDIFKNLAKKEATLKKPQG